MESRRNIISSVQRIAKEAGRTPTMSEFLDKHRGTTQRHHIYKIFGSWNALLVEAGLPVNKRRGPNNPNTSTEGLIRQVKALANKLGKTPTKKEFNDCPETASSETAVSHFGSWNKFLREAGLTINQSMSMNTTDELLVAQVRMLAKELERTPRYLEFSKDSRTVACSVIKKRFGSWGSFLEFAGLEVTQKREFGEGKISNEVLISQLKTLANKLGRTPTINDFKANTETSGGNTVIERFGTWNNFLTAAGFEPNFKMQRGVTREELIEQVKSLALELGRIPKFAEFDKNKNTASTGTVIRRFGSWSRFIQIAGL